ncbi:Ig-like domain-containing protein [Dysgonomonas sp. 520]|uniref:Ig-like domain-containing protein n=1 Tax=Dysgonomonas sp. 520 TaxID=2302931 RepID=UPI0013D25B56|nr:Ig-like domain-containing protein [Dysgonomonas sp. 520]NDW10340.1 hypothetical protein [Dysgonomonas sp. 520]
MNLKVAANQTLIPQIYVSDENMNMGDAMPVIIDDWQLINVPPRFGAITANATSYDKGATIELTIPVLNSKLLQKLFPNNTWLNDIYVTLDGGKTFTNHAYLTFDGINNNIIAIAEAKNQTNSAITVTAEVVHRVKGEPTGPDDVIPTTDYYIYNANTSFIVTSKQAKFKPIESFEFTLPKDNYVNINLPNVAILAKTNPIESTFKTGTWTSSDPAVAEVSVNGILKPKSYGKTTITFTSHEVEYRELMDIEANNDVLIQSFDIYVVGDYPEWSIANDSGYYKMINEPNRNNIWVSHNLKNSDWKVDGEVSVKVIHSDSEQYQPIVDAFEVTPSMLENARGLVYNIPFNDHTFPKKPTAFEAWRADTIWAKPYRVEMSFPLKQTVGDRVMTCVLRDTFNIHLLLPEKPEVRLIRDVPVEVMVGEDLTLKYEVKYLNKDNPNYHGFEVFIGKQWYD